jgi:hypothetical protein
MQENKDFKRRRKLIRIVHEVYKVAVVYWGHRDSCRREKVP